MKINFATIIVGSETKNKKNRINKKNEQEQARAFKRRVRKIITHRNGVPLLTRKLIRDLKAHINPLEQTHYYLKKCISFSSNRFGKFNRYQKPILYRI